MEKSLLTLNHYLFCSHSAESENEQRYIRINQTDGSAIELALNTIDSIEIFAKDNAAEEIPVDDSHEYVDLGLPSGTLWATCNVGANSPDEKGELFAWGETSPKGEYDWSNYKYCNGSDKTLTKYCTHEDDGIMDSIVVLEPIDDAATANLDDEWRTPTFEELSELRRYCKWEWVELNGKFGYKVSSNAKGNNKYIFFPSIGWRNFNRFGYSFLRQDCGEFWTSLLVGARNSKCAYSFGFSEEGQSFGTAFRFEGKFIRPVRCSKIKSE